MSPLSPRRKVLVIEDEPSIRNILFVLLAGIGLDAEIATSGRQALVMVEREKFDAVLLDLRCSNVQPDDLVGGVERIRPSLIGRVLVITGEVADARAMDMIERHFLVPIPRDRLKSDLLGKIQAMLTISPSPKIPPV